MNNAFRFVGGPSHGYTIAVQQPTGPFYVATFPPFRIPLYGMEPDSRVETYETEYRKFHVSYGSLHGNFYVQEYVFAPVNMDPTEVRRMWRTLPLLPIE